MEKQTVEIWLAINETGDAAVSLEGAVEAVEALAGDYQSAAVRTVKLTAKLALPQVIETEVDVPDEAGETQQVDAEAA
jgi:hypothetical protein